MLKMTLRHCNIRGHEISPSKELEFQSHEEAEAYVRGLPHVRGKEYFYGRVEYYNEVKVIDPTFNHQYNLQQNFLSAIFGKNR